MSDSLRSDGKAVEVTLTSAKAKGVPVYLDGFHGITMQAGSSGDTVAIEVALREHEVLIPSNLSAAKGAILYISTAGVITTTNTDIPFLKVTVAKDANNYVWGLLLPQGAKSV